jgi:DNA polymerase III epsilon subunit-like protein
MPKKATADNSEQVYCSVDLEFTGFDPSRDQILEIGIAFFKLSSDGKQTFEITEQWDQVFKPSIEVHPKILGLTGITQEELDNAPEFSEHREFLQEKLGNAIIVGHNPVMDVKFLESYGINLSGKVIDTLELVQFILPTHHSYNLENLVHYFGIKHTVDGQAHRALIDALSTIAVMENLMQIHQQFPEKLKEELQSVINRGNFLWNDLLAAKLPEKKIQSNDSLQHATDLSKLAPLELSKGLITIDNNPIDHETQVALGLQKDKNSTVLVVPDASTVLRLWRNELVHGVFRTEDTFSLAAFNSFLERAEAEEELRFCLKIIVWLHTNWQSEVVFDLNISFFGGQYREFIVGGEPKLSTDKLLCVDYVTLQTLKQKNDSIVICDIQQFEKHMSSGFGSRLSWSGVLYSLKLLYNPENDFDNLEIKDEVTAALVGADLFFGLAYMLLHKTFPNKEYATLSELSGSHEHILSRLQRAAENLQEKIAVVEKVSQTSELTRTTKFLESFFEITPNRVKWINIDERNLTFADLPIEIKDNVMSLLKNYKNIKFTDTISSHQLLSYFVDRLGLDTELSELPNKMTPNRLTIAFNEERLSDDELYKMSTGIALPLVIVMPNPQSIKNFYNDHYQEIKKNAALFAQGYSGGGNKMFRNFSIKENSVLLVTADFMARQNYKISAQTVIFTELPSVEDTHPYTAALLDHWKKHHPNLKSLFSFAKAADALKKLKLNNNVTVNLFNAGEKNIFVDKLR